MRRVGIGSEKTEKKNVGSDAKLKKEIKDLKTANAVLQEENAALREQLQAVSGK